MLILMEMSELCEQPLISTVLDVIKTVFNIIKIGVPLFLIVLCAIDLFKAMTSGDEKKQQEVRKVIVRRLIYALAIFLIIPLLNLILQLVSSVVKIDGKNADTVSTFEAFLTCWGYDNDSATTNSNNNDSNNDTTKCTCVEPGTNKYLGKLTESSCSANNGVCVE